MSRKYQLSARAQRDWLAIVNYLDDRSELAGDRFIRDVEDRVSWLARYPNAGRVVDGSRQRPGALRIITVSSSFDQYLIFYRAYRLTLRVVHIKHGARDWRAILGLE